MYGIFVNGRSSVFRPKSKKAIKEAIAANEQVHLENTGLFGGYDGPLTDAPDGTYTFVGPDPYTNRKFYGNIIVAGGKVKKVS